MMITIRRGVSSDVPRLLELYSLLEFGASKTLSLEEAQLRFLRYRNYPDYNVYVAEADGVIVGTFSLMIVDSIAHGGVPFGIVEDVAVHPDCQRKGIGQRMMQFAMTHCREKRCYKLALSSHLKREQAHKFYESLGFEQHGFSFLVQ